MIKLSNGNLKLGNDTLILNMTSAANCPSKKLGLCRVGNKCYAAKAERLYPNVLPYRNEQERIWDSQDAHEIAQGIFSVIDHKRHPITYLRFSESGDFKAQLDVDKMSLLSDLLKGSLRVYGYTSRVDLDYSKVSDNMTVNGTMHMIHNSFIPTEDTSGDYDIICPGDCRGCHACKSRNGWRIANEYH